MSNPTVLINTYDNKTFVPMVLDGMTLETHRRGQPGKLSFKVLQDNVLEMEEGSIVQLRQGDGCVFRGIVFTRKLDKNGIVSVTAYDQLRYLKNKHFYNVTGKTATEVIKALAADFGVKCGKLADTQYVMPRYRAGEQTLFDFMQATLDETTRNTRINYVLYDKCGELTISPIEDLFVPILIDSETAENYDYEASIDKDTYNRIVIYYDDNDAKERKALAYPSSTDGDKDKRETVTKWGLLQYTESINDSKAVNPQQKAKMLWEQHNRVKRTLSIRNAIGDDRVRGGSSIYVRLHIDGQDIDMRMLVESVQHKYSNNEHFMDLSLTGGMFD